MIFVADTEIKFPGNYKLNPFTGTCVGLISQDMKWDDAKFYCERKGEFLVTFKNSDSANWFIHQRLYDSVQNQKI